jgi:hypothetical protein
MSKRKYSVHWEDDDPVSCEVDAMIYERLEQVPDEADRAKLEARVQSLGSSALMWILPGITGILGLAFLGAVVAVQRLMTPEEYSPHELA